MQVCENSASCLSKFGLSTSQGQIHLQFRKLRGKVFHHERDRHPPALPYPAELGLRSGGLHPLALLQLVRLLRGARSAYSPPLAACPHWRPANGCRWLGRGAPCSRRRRRRVSRQVTGRRGSPQPDWSVRLCLARHSCAQAGCWGGWVDPRRRVSRQVRRAPIPSLSLPPADTPVWQLLYRPTQGPRYLVPSRFITPCPLLSHCVSHFPSSLAAARLVCLARHSCA